MAAFHKNIGILILAAGSSTRMGHPKQLLPWKNTTLVGNAIQNALATRCEAICVVLGANAKLIHKQAIHHHEIEVIENLAWQSGMGSSIAAGMDFILKKNRDFDGILIMLADQPLIDTDYLNKMITLFYSSTHSIVATAYKNRAGVPALFDKSYFTELAQLTQDYGAKELISQNKNEVLTLDPKEKSIDIDTESEYNQLINKIK